MKRYVQTTIGLVAGVVVLWLLLRGISWAELRTSLVNASLVWMGLALVPLLASFFFRILRWQYIVRAVRPEATFRSLFSATQIGFLVNFLLPARLGELVRAVVLAKLERVPASQALALVALDRVADLIGLLAMIGVALVSFEPVPIEIPKSLIGTTENVVIRPEFIRSAELGALVFFLAMCGMLGTLYVSRQPVLKVTGYIVGFISKRLADRICLLLDQFAQGLHVFRSPLDMGKSLAFNLLTWGCFVLASAAFCEAFDLAWPWYTPFVLQIGVAVFISVPGSPGFIGQYQLGVLAGLLMTVPQLNLPDAVAIALLSHATNFLCVTILGAFSLYREGLSLFELTRESERVT